MHIRKKCNWGAGAGGLARAPSRGSAGDPVGAPATTAQTVRGRKRTAKRDAASAPT